METHSNQMLKQQNADGTSTSLIPGLVTIEEKAQKKNDVKTLFAAIQTRFGGNDATKKTRKTLLKQIRIVKNVSWTYLWVKIFSQEDLNLNFLESVPSEWNTHVVVKGTASSSSSSSSQNMAFVSSPSSTNEVNTTYGVSTANTQVSPASTQLYGDDEVPTNIGFLWSFSELRIELNNLVSTLAITRGLAFVVRRATWLFSPLNLDLSNSGLEVFQQPEFVGCGPKTSKSVSKDITNEVKESPDAPLVKELMSDDKLEKKTIFPTVAKIEFVRPKQQEKPVRKPVKYAEIYRLKVVNTARPNSAVVNAVRANQGHPQKEDQGYVDSGCSRHMTGNMSYLSDFKEFDGGYVTFGGGTKGGKITGRGTLKTGKLNFEDVYFVKEL
ncbi:hypothetical protein Tco_0201259 [Tanacetum coccineum]